MLRCGDCVGWTGFATIVGAVRQRSDYGQAVGIESLRMRQGAGRVVYSTQVAGEASGGGVRRTERDWQARSQIIGRQAGSIRNGIVQQRQGNVGESAW